MKSSSHLAVFLSRFTRISCLSLSFAGLSLSFFCTPLLCFVRNPTSTLALFSFASLLSYTFFRPNFSYSLALLSPFLLKLLPNVSDRRFEVI